MSVTPDKSVFDARIAQLGLDHLPQAEIARLWASYVKQQWLSKTFDTLVAPATEPALSFQADRV